MGEKGHFVPLFRHFWAKNAVFGPKGRKRPPQRLFPPGFPAPNRGSRPRRAPILANFRTSKTRSGISPASIPNLFVSSRPGSGESELRSSKASGLVPELQMIAGQERSRIFDSHAAIAFRDANSAARARIFRRNRGSGGFETRFGGKSELIWALKLQV